MLRCSACTIRHGGPRKLSNTGSNTGSLVRMHITPPTQVLRASVGVFNKELGDMTWRVRRSDPSLVGAQPSALPSELQCKFIS